MTFIYYTGTMRKHRFQHADGWLALVVREDSGDWVKAPDGTVLVVLGKMRKQRTGRVIVAREVNVQETIG